MQIKILVEWPLFHVSYSLLMEEAQGHLEEAVGIWDVTVKTQLSRGEQKIASLNLGTVTEAR